jgi:hypothetical protein
MIIASICTIPVRKKSFKQVAQRILHEQTLPIDQLHVWLNGYQTIDTDLPQDPRLVYHLEPTNPGPQSRYRVGEFIPDDAIVLTLDDDLIYPMDYIETGVRALEKQGDRVSVCFGGVFWDGVVPIASLEYHAHKRLIPCPGQLEQDTPVPVLMGGAAFHEASVFKGLLSYELPGFATNDDLMASFNLQKQNGRIVCVAKPANWIKEFPEQSADHALWRRDAQKRIAVFKTLVGEYGLIPWGVDLGQMRSAPARLVVSAGALSDSDIVKLYADHSTIQGLHTLEIVEGGIGNLASRTWRAHQEHFVSVPARGGRFNNLLPVRAFREWRIRQLGAESIYQYLRWLEQSLNLASVGFMDAGGLPWIKNLVVPWIQAQHRISHV